MKILLNGMALVREAGGDLLLGQVLEELQSEIHENGKVLLEARMDGVIIEHSYKRRKQLATPVSQIEKLELLIQNTDSAKQLIFKDSLEIQAQVQAELPELATRFRIGDAFDANQQLASVLDRVNLSMKGAMLAMPSPAGQSDTYARAGLIGDKLLPALSRIMTAQTKGDYTALADELEFRLPQTLRECGFILSNSQFNCG